MVAAATRAAGTTGSAAGRSIFSGKKSERAFKIPVRGARAFGAYNIAALFDRNKLIKIMLTIYTDKRV